VGHSNTPRKASLCGEWPVDDNPFGEVSQKTMINKAKRIFVVVEREQLAKHLQ